MSTHRVLNQCLESLVQKCQTGVVIQLEKTGLDPSPVNDGIVKVKNMLNILLSRLTVFSRADYYFSKFCTFFVNIYCETI